MNQPVGDPFHVTMLLLLTMRDRFCQWNSSRFRSIRIAQLPSAKAGAAQAEGLRALPAESETHTQRVTKHYLVAQNKKLVQLAATE